MTADRALGAACHSATGDPGPGPAWKGLYNKQETLADGSVVRVEEAYLRRAILEPDAQIVKGFPPGMMPRDFGQKLSKEDMKAIHRLHQGFEVNAGTSVICDSWSTSESSRLRQHRRHDCHDFRSRLRPCSPPRWPSRCMGLLCRTWAWCEPAQAHIHHRFGSIPNGVMFHQGKDGHPAEVEA